MTAVKSKYDDLGRPDPEWAEVGVNFDQDEPPILIDIYQFYSAHGAAIPILEGSATHMRKVLADLKESTKGLAPTVQSGISVNDERIAVSDGAKIAVRIYQPISAEQSLHPGIL